MDAITFVSTSLGNTHVANALNSSNDCNKTQSEVVSVKSSGTSTKEKTAGKESSWTLWANIHYLKELFTRWLKNLNHM